MDSSQAPMPVLPFPRRIECRGGVHLRPWTIDDAEELGELIYENLDHLRPYMPWIVAEPMAVEDREELLAKWVADFDSGQKDAVYGVFLGERAAGSTGYHRRVGADGLEIGYWVDHRLARRGIATEVTRALTDHAFTFSGIDFVEVHHDVSNTASSGVPRNLGFAQLGTVHAPAGAPAETGVHAVWRVTRDRWSTIAQS